MQTWIARPGRPGGWNAPAVCLALAVAAALPAAAGQVTDAAPPPGRERIAAAATPPGELFDAVAADAHRADSDTASGATGDANSARAPLDLIRQRPVAVRAELLADRAVGERAAVRLSLFDGAAVNAVMDRYESLPDGGVAGFGRIAGATFGHFIFVQRGAAFAASIHAPPQGWFDVQVDPVGQAWLRQRGGPGHPSMRCGAVAAALQSDGDGAADDESGPAAQPDLPARSELNHRLEAGATTTSSAGSASSADAPSNTGSSSSAGSALNAAAARHAQPRGALACPIYLTPLAGYTADSGAMVDLMVVYTAAARDAAGGVAQIEVNIDLAASIANQAYANSLITPRLRVVRKALISYTESGDNILDLNRLVAVGDGHLDSVHPDRDTYGADLVSLWLAGGPSGGAAYQLAALWPDDDGRNCFSVLRQDSAPFDTLAHEVGHNFGCAHDRPNAFGVAFFPYAYGYREPGSLWHDIMSYPPGDPILYFSNPDVIYNGPPGNPGPTGIAGEDPNTSCDCARAHDETAFTLANFRPSTLESPPPARLYVRAAASPGGSGASWATAMNSVQQAILTSVQARGAVTEIWVAAGTYKPDQGTNNRARSFRLAQGVTIYGGFAGTETLLAQRNVAANVTTLTGDIGTNGDPSDNSLHVVTAADLDGTAVLDGFTIRGGNANAAYPHDGGGGLFVRCGSPTIRNCTFLFNQGTNGGGAQLLDGSAPSFVDCTFSHNSAVSDGGGLMCRNSTADFSGCVFVSNTAQSGGGAELLDGSTGTFDGCTFATNSSATSGGGLACFSTSPTVTGCTFEGNDAVDGGAGLHLASLSAANVVACDFNSNTSAFGAGLHATGGSDAVIQDCSFNGNTANDGAGAYVYNSSPTLTGCTFEGNVAGSVENQFGAGGAFVVNAGGAPTLTDCTFTDNVAGCCGGAVATFSSPATVVGAMFIGNSGLFGGAVWTADAGAPLLINSLFLGNTVGFGGGAWHTSGGSTAVAAGCVFSGNSADEGFGGALYNVSASPTLVNCTLSHNAAAFGGGGIASDATVALANCILRSNSDPSGMTQSAQITHFGPAVTTVNYSLVHGWTGSLGGAGNSGADPLFVDADGADNAAGTPDDNVQVAIGSPAIDSGRNSDVPVYLAVDPLGVPRRMNVACVADSGVGSAPIVDRGAYERLGAAVPGDMNGSGTVTVIDVPDFVSVMLQSDLDPLHIGAADVNCDGAADADDVQPFVELVIP